MNTEQRKIYHYLTRQIAEHKLKVDNRLPTEMELAKKFHTNRMNAHNAVKKLEEEGLVRRNKKQGTLVNAGMSWPIASELKNLSADRAHVIASLEKATSIHWNQSTLNDLEEILRNDGRELFYEKLPEDATKKDLKRIIDVINETGSSAIIFMPEKKETELLIKNIDIILNYRGDIYLFERGTGTMDEWPFHLIRLDPFSEGIKAARFLYGNGHRNIVYAYAYHGRIPHKDRSSFWAIKREHGLCYELRSLSEGKLKLRSFKYADDDYEKQVYKELRKADKKLTLVAQNDAHAARIIDYAVTRGLEAPRDFYLMAFDNDTKYRNYNLTTIAPPINKIGKIIGQLVCDKHNWIENGEKITLRLSSKVIERKTCGKA